MWLRVGKRSGGRKWKAKTKKLTCPRLIVGNSYFIRWQRNAIGMRNRFCCRCCSSCGTISKVLYVVTLEMEKKINSLELDCELYEHFWFEDCRTHSLLFTDSLTIRQPWLGLFIKPAAQNSLFLLAPPLKMWTIITVSYLEIT